MAAWRVIASLLLAGFTPRAHLPQAHTDPHRSVLHVDSLGTGGPRIVFLAGLGATSSYWSTRVAALADSFQLLLPDPLGFGRSHRPDTVYSIEFQAQALQELMTPGAPAILVGHSLGALVAATYARVHPEQVRGLVLISTPVFASKADAVAQLSGGNPFKRWVLANRTPTALFCTFTRRIARPFIPLLAPHMPNDIRDDATAHTTRAATSALHDGLYDVDGHQLLRAIPRDIPVFVIHGERDRTAPWGAVREVLLSRPEWQQLVLPEADHHPLLRSPDLVMQAIREFLAGLGSLPLRPIAARG